MKLGKYTKDHFLTPCSIHYFFKYYDLSYQTRMIYLYLMKCEWLRLIPWRKKNRFAPIIVSRNRHPFTKIYRKTTLNYLQIDPYRFLVCVKEFVEKGLIIVPSKRERGYFWFKINHLNPLLCPKNPPKKNHFIYFPYYKNTTIHLKNRTDFDLKWTDSCYVDWLLKQVNLNMNLSRKSEKEVLVPHLRRLKICSAIGLKNESSVTEMNRKLEQIGFLKMDRHRTYFDLIIRVEHELLGWKSN